MAKQKTVAASAKQPVKKARGAASKIRHGGKAGKDTATEVLERAFGSIFANKVVMALVIALLLGGVIGFTLLHKANSDKAAAAAAAREALAKSRAPGEKAAVVTEIKEWLEKYEGEAGELDVRLFLISIYESLAKDNSDPEMLRLAIAQVQLLREDFGDEPLVSEEVNLPDKPKNWLRALEDRLVADKKALPGLDDKFRKPDAN